jgi:hypothetical protein
MAGINKDQQRWKAENDARVMALYQEIISDKNRMNRAIKEANRQAADLTRRASAMKSAANVRKSGGSISRRKK